MFETFAWFLILNKIDFQNFGLYSRALTLDLKGIGRKEFLITRGNRISVTVDDEFLSVGLNDLNPFYNHEGTHGIYKTDDGNIYLGFKK